MTTTGQVQGAIAAGDFWLDKFGNTCGNPAAGQVMGPLGRVQLGQEWFAWTGTEMETVPTTRSKVEATTQVARSQKGWSFMTANFRGNMEPSGKGGKISYTAKSKVREAVRTAQEYRTDIMAITETGISQAGEVEVREWIKELNDEVRWAEPRYEVVPHFSWAENGDGSPLRHRGALVLLSKELKEKLDPRFDVELAPRGRGMALHFADKAHGTAHVAVVYGVASPDEELQAGDALPGKAERQLLAKWLRTIGTKAGKEPMMVMGDLNSVPADRDRLHTDGTFGRTATDDDPDSMVKVCLELGLSDLWRIKNPEVIAITHTQTAMHKGENMKSLHGARLDGIWGSTAWVEATLRAGIAPIRAGKDHRAVGVLVDKDMMIRGDGGVDEAKMACPYKIEWGDISETQYSGFKRSTGRGMSRKALLDSAARVDATRKSTNKAEQRTAHARLGKVINRVCSIGEQCHLTPDESDLPEQISKQQERRQAKETDRAEKAEAAKGALAMAALMQAIQTPTATRGGGVGGRCGVVARLLSHLEDWSQAPPRAAELMEIRRIARVAEVGCLPLEPIAKAHTYDARAWAIALESVVADNYSACIVDKLAEAKEAAQQTVDKVGMWDEVTKRGLTAEFWRKMYPKVFAEKLGVVTRPEYDEVTGQWTRKNVTDAGYLGRAVEMYTRRLNRNKTEYTTCFDDETDSIAPKPGYHGRAHLLMFEPLGIDRAAHEAKAKQLDQQREGVDGNEEFWEGMPLPASTWAKIREGVFKFWEWESEFHEKGKALTKPTPKEAEADTGEMIKGAFEKADTTAETYDQIRKDSSRSGYSPFSMELRRVAHQRAQQAKARVAAMLAQIGEDTEGDGDDLGHNTTEGDKRTTGVKKGIHMGWRPAEKPAAWKRELVVEQPDGKRRMSHWAERAAKEVTGRTSSKDLIWDAFQPIERGNPANAQRLKELWHGAMQGNVTLEELEAYLQGKADDSGPGPSQLRYGHIAHGSPELKKAVCTYISAILHGNLSTDERRKGNEEPLEAGDRVEWTEHDTDIPAGRVGILTKKATTSEDEAERWEVQFQQDRYLIKTDEIQRESVKSFTRRRRVNRWPDTALHSIITYLRKKPGMELTSYRPVTLQQSLTKILNGVIAERMNQVLTAGAVLDPAQAGFISGGSVDNALQTVMAPMEHAYRARQERAGAEGTGDINLCFFDFSNAYNSVPGWLLELALRRIHTPEHVIDLMVGMVEGQRVAVRTAAGLTRDFSLDGGLPQGDPCSPILWAICLDPLL
jgi:exonuclease III